MQRFPTIVAQASWRFLIGKDKHHTDRISWRGYLLKEQGAKGWNLQYAHVEFTFLGGPFPLFQRASASSYLSSSCLCTSKQRFLTTLALHWHSDRGFVDLVFRYIVYSGSRAVYVKLYDWRRGSKWRVYPLV